MGRRGRILVTIGLCVALVGPVALNRDGFPLSTYPMYSRSRGSTVSLVAARAVDDDGRSSALSLTVIGNSDDPLIVAGELRDAIADGRAEERCVEIARRAARWSGLASEATTVEVVTERLDAVEHVAGRAGSTSTTVHATCEVET